MGEVDTIILKSCVLIKMHTCYMIYSKSLNRVYIGYTVDFNRRLMQHNGFLSGGAKKTKIGRPWIPIVNVNGFLDNHQALRFEYRWQKMSKRAPKKYSKILAKGVINRSINIMNILISLEDGKKDHKVSWEIKFINFF